MLTYTNANLYLVKRQLMQIQEWAETLPWKCELEMQLECQMISYNLKQRIIPCGHTFSLALSLFCLTSINVPVQLMQAIYII